jgi:hypothetical protein
LPSIHDGCTSLTRIVAEQRDVPLLQPRHDRRVQAGGVRRHVPRPFLRALHPAAGAQEERVAAADLDARELFPRLEIRRVDRRAGSRYGTFFIRGRSTMMPRVMIPLFWFSTPFCGQPGPARYRDRAKPL